MEADELTDIAEYYMTGKQDAKANQAIQAAIDMHPDSVDPQIFLARQRMFYGKLDEARNIIDGITEQDDQEVIYIRAELLIKEGQADKASDFLLEQMPMMQDSLDTYLYDCVSIFMDYDRWELAQDWLLQLKDNYPDHPRLPIMEAEIKMGLDDYESAYTLLKAILEEEPYCSEAWNLLAETCVALDNMAEAIEAADYSLAINPQDNNALLMKANAFMHEGQMPEAIEHYRKYLESQPDDLSVTLSLALCYCNEERFKEVLPLLDKAEQYALKLPDREADLSQILQLKAFALSRLDRTSEAISLVEKAKEYIKTEIEKSGDAQSAEAAHFADALIQNQKLDSDNSVSRDALMAENVLWILEQEKARGSERIFVSGHNGHVEKTGGYAGMGKVMGNLLADELGDEYFSIGTDFYKTTCNVPKGDSYERTTHLFYSHDPLAKASMKCGNDVSWLDFSAVPDSSALRQQLDEAVWTGSVGEYYSPVMAFMPMMYRVWGVPTQLYDGMIFVSDAAPTEIIEITE